MNTQDRAVVKALLQHMTDKCLTGSEEFRAALKHFNITTTYAGQKMSDEIAALFGCESNYFVDVFAPGTIDAEKHGVRHFFDSKEQADALAPRERSNGEEPVAPAVVEDEPDAITITEALAMFLDRYAVLDAQAVGKRYIVAIPCSSHDGKLIKHGTYNTRSEAQTALNNLPNTRGITRGVLVALKAL